MKPASCSETLRKLYTTKSFPSPDMVAEVHWAYKTETFHMKADEKFLQREEGVDIIPAWSLSALLNALPSSLSIREDEDCLDSVEYKLSVSPGNSGEISTVSYVDAENILFCETMAEELVDAVVNMIELLDDKEIQLK